jgi:hypothetical protein
MGPRISILTLGVDDLAASTTFYRDGLGFPEYDRDGDVRSFELPGTWLALYPREDLAADAGVPAGGSGFASVTLAHTVASTADVDAVVSAAETAGADVVRPARATDWGGYPGSFADLDGHLWEVAWGPDLDPGG